MPLHRERDRTLDDVEVLGTWNFTLQGDTPLYWIKSGVLDRYHMRFKVQTLCPSTCGIVVHAEADQAGTDGVSFWIERRKAKENEEKDSRRYILSGSGLDSRSIVTRPFQDDGGGHCEEVEVLVQGHTGAIFLQNRKITLKFKMKESRGCIAFYNSSSVKGGQDDVHFSDVRITALRRGPLELQGTLGKRERAILALDERPEQDEPAENQNTLEPESEGVASGAGVPMGGGAVPAAAALGATDAKKPGGGDARATCSTFAPSATDARAGTFSELRTTGVRTTTASGFGSPNATARSESRGTATPLRGGTGTPSRHRLSPGSDRSSRPFMQKTGGGGGGGGAAEWGGKTSPAFIRRSSSENGLRKTAGSMWGLPPATRTAAASGRWVAQPLNAPDKEHKLLHSTMRTKGDGAGHRTCADFIRVEQH